MLRKLEKYDILEEIGHGGMATVYRARDEHLDREVAIKVLHPHLRGAEEARSRFEREARSVAKLRHPNILEIYDYSGVGSEESYIAAELLTGPTLKHFAEAHPDMPPEIAACFVIEIARALGAAHALGIIHRDVKPENVLIHDDRCVKLTDFGIAQLVDAQSFTATGQVLGSPGHMAPEQVEGKDCDARTDLFSLGTVLYYLSTGRLPFSGRNPHQVLKRIVDGEYADPMRVRPAIGGQMAAIIRRALARDPAERYQSAEELERDLVQFVGQVGIDDPERELAAYLTDPEGHSEALRERIVQAHTELGENAARDRSYRQALDHFNRVLALDEGNERVLDQVDRLQRRGERQRRLIVAAGVLLGLVGVGAIGLALYGRSVPEAGPAVAGSGATEGTEIGIDDDTTSVGEGEPIPGVSVIPDSLGGDAGAAAGETGREPARAASSPRGETRRLRRGTTPRTVVFRPEPANVLISVDGSEARPFGPSFHRMELAPGVHRFTFRSGSDCCEDVTFRRRVPAGPGTTIVARALPLKPAGLYVVSNVPADVKVDGGRARGRTREVIRVPMGDDVEDVARLTVTAAGHRVYTGAVRLRAGQIAQVDVQLEAAEGASR